jgi:hypothetical protein
MSVAGFTNRTQFPALFGPDQLAALELVVMSQGAFPDSNRDRLFRMISTDRDIWRSQDILDLPLAMEIPEGTQYTASRIGQGLGKTFVPKKSGGMVSITKEMMQDARFDAMGNWARKLGESIAQTREISAMNIFNNGFTTALAQDGQSVFSAAHTVGSLTFSNNITGNPDLSESSLQAALAQFERAFIRSNGTYINSKPRVLLVSPENKRYAMELTMSQGKADTTDNNINSIRVNDNLMVVSSPYLTDPDAWFLLAAPEQTGLFIIERQGVETASSGYNDGPGFTTDSALIKASYREDIGVTNAYGILGSSGT